MNGRDKTKQAAIISSTSIISELVTSFLSKPVSKDEVPRAKIDQMFPGMYLFNSENAQT